MASTREGRTLAAAAGVALAVALGAAAALATTGTAGGQGIDDIRLVDQDGQARSPRDWHGRVTVVDFVFVGCGDVCPLRTADLADARAAMTPATRDAVGFASVTVDPAHDDPAALKAYADRLGAGGPGWRFLTGSPSDIARLAAAFDGPAWVGTGDPATHVDTLYLLDGAGRIAKAYQGERIDALALARDAAALASRTDAPQGR